MSNQLPSWGPPPAPKPKDERPWWKKKPLIILGAILAAMLMFGGCLGLLFTGMDSVTDRDVTVKGSASTSEETTPETVPEESPEPTEGTAESGPVVGRVGQTLVLSDGFGTKQAEIMITKVKFSTGGEYDEPEHGLYMGAYIKVEAFVDDVDSPWGDLHVNQSGRHYDGDACCPDGFKPDLEYVTLSKGEKTEGWLIFDVPSRHGEIVYTDRFEGRKLGGWKF